MQCNTSIFEPKPISRFLHRKEILSAVGVSNSTLWRLIKSGSFPKPTQIGPNSVAWKQCEYERWAIDPKAWAEQHRTNPA